MDNNTHEEFLVLEDGLTAFITGVPDKCLHQWNDQVMHTESGKVITWKTYPKWAGFTSQFRYRLVYNLHESNGDPIVGAASACSKCGKEFVPPMF